MDLLVKLQILKKSLQRHLTFQTPHLPELSLGETAAQREVPILRVERKIGACHCLVALT